MDLIIWNMVGAIKNDYAIRVVIDVVVLDPREPGLDRENPLRPRLVDQIIQNNCVRWIISTVSDVRFVVLKNVVFLNVPRSCVYK